MVGFAKNIVALTAVLSFFGAAIAAPAPEVDYAKLIEVAPGYPTVEELGLTNADLTKPVPEIDEIVARDMLLQKRYEPRCWGEPRCTVNDARACYNYLNSIGGNRCEVRGRVQMCKMGGCAWDARTLNNAFASSSCRDAALGGAWVLNNCISNNRVAGSNAAFGNGNLIVDIIGR
ncbi:hypothetical protein TWF730_004486 [Orbilia blumenaviensis]|uniref:Uncharacterized protein n=1 Tax=Orbilia blumenaviensis TaxID=1796055 RepID=A0AAV9TYQ5_9PEZI